MTRKALILIVLFFVVVLNGYAQRMFATDRGSLQLGGSIFLSSAGGDLYEVDGDRTFDFNFNPDFEIFVAPSFSIGAEILFSYYSFGGSNSTNLGVGPSLTYYIAGHVDRKVYPYIGLSYLISTYNFSSSASSNESLNSRSITRLGVMFMLSNSVALNTEFNYMAITRDLTDSPTSGNQFYLGLGIKAFIF